MKSFIHGTRYGLYALAVSMSLGMAQAADETTLVVGHSFTAHNAEVIESIKEEFEKKNPGIAVHLKHTGPNWEQHLQATLRGSIVGDLPDVSHQSLTFTRILLDRGLSQPLNDLSGGIEGLEAMGLPRSLIETATFDGKVYALPFGTTIPVVYYNMDLLRKAGYAGDGPPKTWPEIIDVAKKVAALGNGINGGYIEYSASNAWMFQNLLASLGGTMMKPDETDIAFDGALGLRALEILRDFGSAMAADMTKKQARQAFNAGVTGILIRSASGVPSILKAAKGNFEVQIGEFPVPEAGGRIVGAGHGVVMFAKDPARQKAAWEYIKFVTGPEGQTILAQRTGYMPINMIAVNDPRYLSKYYEENPYHRAIVARLSITSDWYSFPQNTIKIFDVMVEQMRAVLTQETSPKDALSTMARETRELL